MSEFSSFERVSAAVGMGILSVGCIAVALIDPTRTGIFPACPLLSITGFACPGCGLTRGFHALFHGDFITALDYNALIPFFVIIFGYIFLLLANIAIRGRSLKFSILQPTALWTFLIAAFVFGVLRNVPFYPLSVLFP